MLANKDKEKIEKYVDKIIAGLRKDARNSMESGMNHKQVLERVTRATVNKFTPESKMIMSSVYNMLMEETLRKPLYSVAEHKAAFYQLDILSELNRKFVFDVPSNIDYEESKKMVDEWVKGGAAGVVVVGGAVSVCVKSLVPVGVSIALSAMFVGIMALMKMPNDSKCSDDMNKLIDDYFKGVKNSIFAWIESIVSFYDSKVEVLEKEMRA